MQNNILSNRAEIDFLQSAFQIEGYYLTNQQVVAWAVAVNIEPIPFEKMNKWSFHPKTGNLEHESRKFFAIEGIQIATNWGNNSNWSQPIINQPEIGFLGFITKKIKGVLHFLIQAKIEPGNINFVQLSPTLQATKSNYSKVHKGKTPLYLGYFNGEKNARVLLDQLQSEQGSRFLKKRNRNMIVEIEEEIEIDDDFCWVTLGQIKSLLKQDNLVNMDTRTVISGISFGSYPQNGVALVRHFVYQQRDDGDRKQQMLLSALNSENGYYSFEEILSWITRLKSKFELDVNRIPLAEVQGWVKTPTEIHHKDRKYFSVIGCNIHIGNREVVSWCQPLIKSAQEGIIAFLVKQINGIPHFLVQAKVEAGNFDILELAPTVQCLTGNYRKGLNEYEVPFIREVLETTPERVLYRSLQSEEGGRFYREQNLNIIAEVKDDFLAELPENYMWMTLNQLYTFIKFNNYLNIQARSLLAAVTF